MTHDHIDLIGLHQKLNTFTLLVGHTATSFNDFIEIGFDLTSR